MNRVPRQSPGCDIKSLPLKPSEAYLLSRIDAAVTERELALITGLPQAEVEAALDRLVELGAIQFVGANGAPIPSAVSRTEATMPPPAPIPPPPITQKEGVRPGGRTDAARSAARPD